MDAFGALVRMYENRVGAVAFRIVGDRDAALDVAQEVFIRLYRFLPRFNAEKRFFTWLYRIVVNASYDYLRKNHRFQTVPLDDPSFRALSDGSAADASEDDMRRRIHDLLDLLSVPQRTAFLLREVEGFSCEDIARVMACPAGTVRSHIHLARKKMRMLIEKHYPEYLEGMRNDM
jgi:RNA polymerase sigma-70 factor (ECF subfamily)